MPISRIFQNTPLNLGSLVQLSDQAAHHVARVLRASLNDEIILFNGQGGEYQGLITVIDKKKVMVKVREFIAREAESALQLYLAQGISRGEKMDYTIQKAVELGVKKIIPLFTERCNVKLDQERREKRQQHWQAIAIGACEQSGRNQVPEVMLPQFFDQWIQSVAEEQRFILSPHAHGRLSEHPVAKDDRVVLLIGPEGGFSEKELSLASQKHFLSLNLGPRVLRTETAAIAGIVSLQSHFGDMF